MPAHADKERVTIPVGRARTNARSRMKADHSHHLPEYIAYLLDRVNLAVGLLDKHDSRPD